jgi:AbrB family looped-hinge helix DNA binding protein
MYKYLTSGVDMTMKEITSTITAKGQVTIPAEVRKHLGVKPNDKIAFIIEDEGTVQVAAPRYPDIASLRGAAGSLKKPLSWKEMREIAREDRLKSKYSKKP